MKPTRYHAAFSLVELSIVLVILGLLTGGILGGQSLIRAAELRASVTDLARIKVSVETFRDKYFALPGDMPNATRFWGAQAGGLNDGMDATCWALTAAATGRATCNGNGNGIVETYQPETFRAWQHMANAGLIEGNYAGITGPGGGSGYMKPGYNVYQTRVAQVGIGVAYLSNSSGSAFEFDGTLGHHFILGKDKTDFENSGPFMSPDEAWSMDRKFDDGLPAQGNIFAFPWPDCTTATNSANVAASYALTQSAKVCAAKYRNAF